MEIINKFGGRKVIVTMLAMIVGSLVHVFSSKGLTVEYATLLGSLVGMFKVGNAFERHTDAKATAAPEELPISSAVAEIHTKLDAMTNDADSKAGLQALVDMQEAMKGLVQGNEMTRKLLVTALSQKKQE